jgi:hypothetical protein
MAKQSRNDRTKEISWIGRLAEDPAALVSYDALGAMLSLLLLAFVLPAFSVQLGIPVFHLHLLAIVPAVIILVEMQVLIKRYAVTVSTIKKIALANAIYCLIIIAYLVIYRGEVTGLGSFYLVLDIIVIAAVIGVELLVVKRMTSSQD